MAYHLLYGGKDIFPDEQRLKKALELRIELELKQKIKDRMNLATLLIERQQDSTNLKARGRKLKFDDDTEIL